MVYLFDDFKSQILFRSGTTENCLSKPVLAAPSEDTVEQRLFANLGI